MLLMMCYLNCSNLPKLSLRVDFGLNFTVGAFNWLTDHFVYRQPFRVHHRETVHATHSAHICYFNFGGADSW